MLILNFKKYKQVTFHQIVSLPLNTSMPNISKVTITPNSTNYPKQEI